jgi:hypothetical protein
MILCVLLFKVSITVVVVIVYGLVYARIVICGDVVEYHFD